MTPEQIIDLAIECGDLQAHEDTFCVLFDAKQLAAYTAAVEAPLHARIDRLNREMLVLSVDAEKELDKANARIAELEKAIKLTLDENKHLSDGDNCTLVWIKKALINE
jgi:1-aminocyclopropane-1-carboxylate deaminase/D-cysteine desulfhydrase-like pyridoxal-dependent ACC family enzyme